MYARSRTVAADRTLATLDVAGGLGLHCTLPLAVNGRLATLSLPDGRLTAATVQRGPNDQGNSYASGHWLPVERWAVSPDGRGSVVGRVGRRRPRPPAARLPSGQRVVVRPRVIG